MMRLAQARSGGQHRYHRKKARRPSHEHEYQTQGRLRSQTFSHPLALFLFPFCKGYSVLARPLGPSRRSAMDGRNPQARALRPAGLADNGKDVRTAPRWIDHGEIQT